MTSRQELLDSALDSITRGLEEHKPEHAIYALFSGGTRW
jgi:hypothetical protein